MAKKKSQTKKEKKLKLEQQPLQDLPLKDKEQTDVKGGRAAPYTVIGSE